MREEDIQRYGRQILLRELGGRGQRKLMEARVEVHGDGPALDGAVTYLRAGGTLVGEGGSVVLATQARATPKALVVLGDGVAWKRADACPACFERTVASLPAASAAPVLVGSLAALTAQRLILAWGEPLGLVRWDGERLVSRPPECCAAHAQPR